VSVVRFAGFPDRMTYLPVPAAIFGSLLREIDSLPELKTTLHVCRLLQERRTTPRFVRKSALLADRALLLSLRGDDGAAPEHALTVALDRATRRGTLVATAVRDGDQSDTCFFLNTGANRRIVREVERGERRLGPLEPAPTPAEAGGRDSAAGGIFDLYEQNIGLLTPLLAEELREAELTYPAAWIEDAFREAVGQNKRSWRYIQRILENWTARGRGPGGKTGRRADPPEDSRSYLSGKYGRLIRR
jgi:DNA replication protein